MYPTLNFEGPTPIHEQITNWIRDNILTGVWQENFKLLAESDLADKLGVSRGTVRKAIETLIAEGLLARIHGRGTFVKKNFIFEQQPSGAIAGFSRDLLRREIPFTTEVPLLELVNPSENISNLLNISKKKKIVHMRRIRRIQDKSNILIENHIVYDFCRGIETYDFTENQLYRTLETAFDINFTWARRTYIAKIASKEIAEYLGIEVGSPVMYLEELYHIENDIPAEFTRAWFPGNLFHITTRIQREDEKRDIAGFYR